MKTVFLYYPRCSTCRRAKAWLEAKGVDFVVRDIVEENPSVPELKKWVKKSGLPIKKFFNTSGILYREQKLKDLLPTLSDAAQIEKLAESGLLVKRPLLITTDAVIPGFDEKAWAELLLSS